MKLHAVFIFATVNVVFCEECKLNKRSPESLAEANLEAFLQTCSDLTEPPVNENHTVEVKMGFILQSFAFDESEDGITLYSWNHFSWHDNRLTWKPEDHQNLNSTHISNSVIWNPGLKLVNNADFDYDVASYSYTKCKVNSTGEVKCVVRAEHKVHCSSKLTNWPYDTKTCKLEFSQWRLGEATVIFKLAIKFAMFSSQNSGWQIIRGIVTPRSKTGVQSTIDLELERLAEGLETTFVAPCFVISSLTVTALLLDYKKDARFGILTLGLICHFVFLNEISVNIPKHSWDVPVLLSFISRSTALTVIVFLLSFGFKYFAKKIHRPALWISAFNDFVLDSYGRYVVVTVWDVEDNDPLNPKPREWASFVNIVNSACLVIIIIAYVCLLSIYMPVKVAPKSVDFM